MEPVTKTVPRLEGATVAGSGKWMVAPLRCISCFTFAPPRPIINKWCCGAISSCMLTGSAAYRTHRKLSLTGSAAYRTQEKLSLTGSAAYRTQEKLALTGSAIYRTHRELVLTGSAAYKIHFCLEYIFKHYMADDIPSI